MELINKLEHVFSIDTENASDKIQQPLIGKTFSKSEYTKEYDNTSSSGKCWKRPSESGRRRTLIITTHLQRCI